MCDGLILKAQWEDKHSVEVRITVVGIVTAQGFNVRGDGR